MSLTQAANHTTTIPDGMQLWVENLSLLRHYTLRLEEQMIEINLLRYFLFFLLVEAVEQPLVVV